MDTTGLSYSVDLNTVGYCFLNREQKKVESEMIGQLDDYEAYLFTVTSANILYIVIIFHQIRLFMK